MDTAMAATSTVARRTRGIEPAWPWDWENRPAKDTSQHVWEIVAIDRLFVPDERVARCTNCHTPRCGYAEESDPCTQRRHHDGAHLRQ